MANESKLYKAKVVMKVLPANKHKQNKTTRTVSQQNKTKQDKTTHEEGEVDRT